MSSIKCRLCNHKYSQERWGYCPKCGGHEIEMKENTAETIKELALHDPQVSYAIRFYIDGDLPWVETLERLVILLVENKQLLNKELDRAYSLNRNVTYNVAGNSEILGEV